MVKAELKNKIFNIKDTQSKAKHYCTNRYNCRSNQQKFI